MGRNYLCDASGHNNQALHFFDVDPQRAIDIHTLTNKTHEFHYSSHSSDGGSPPPGKPDNICPISKSPLDNPTLLPPSLSWSVNPNSLSCVETGTGLYSPSWSDDDTRFLSSTFKLDKRL